MWMIDGYNDDGDWSPEFYKTKEKAKEVFDEYVEDRSHLYNVKVEVAQNENGDYTARYDNGSNRYEFWYMTEVK